jgi:predicted metal-dependent hydrolase
MPSNEYNPVAHDHEAFLERAIRRKGFAEAYEALEDEHKIARELLAARISAGLTQEQVARCNLDTAATRNASTSAAPSRFSLPRALGTQGGAGC